MRKGEHQLTKSYSYGNSNLLTSEDFSESDGVVLESLTIDRDAKWDTNLIGSRVTLPYRVTWVVDFRAHTDFSQTNFWKGGEEVMS